MMLKPLFRIPQKMNLRFVKYFKLCLALSVIAIVGTAVLLSTVGLHFGIDFKGGTVLQARTPGPADLGDIRGKLSKLGLGEVQLQSFGRPNEILIRFPEQPGGPDAQNVAADKVAAALPAGTQELGREQVGSIVSGELISGAILALLFTNLVIFAYVWFRFEWQFALGAIVSLIHDVFFTVGVFALFGLDFDKSTIAALLTILGYSITDTVVIYDRIRENLRRYKRMPLGDLLDLSVNETMSRTIMTVGTVFMALLALYFFGGEVIRGFTFAMLVGVLVGTYSSVFIAAPFLVLIGVKRDASALETAKAGKSEAGRAPAAGSSAGPAAPLVSRGAAGADGNAAMNVTVTFGDGPEDSKTALAPAPARKSNTPRRTPPRHGKSHSKARGGRSKKRG